MKWGTPPDIKIYEALGAVADGRVHTDGNSARVYSSSRNKYYEVKYDPAARAIMTNDNGSYWKSYLGYPAIAFLMETRVLNYEPALGNLLKQVAWKDINTKFKNDFEKTLNFILQDFSEETRSELSEYIDRVQREVEALSLNLLGKKRKPPEGY